MAGQADLPKPRIMVTVREGPTSEGEALARFPLSDLLEVGDSFTLPDGSVVVAVLTRELISDAGIDQTVYVRLA